MHLAQAPSFGPKDSHLLGARSNLNRKKERKKIKEGRKQNDVLDKPQNY